MPDQKQKSLHSSYQRSAEVGTNAFFMLFSRLAKLALLIRVIPVTGILKMIFALWNRRLDRQSSHRNAKPQNTAARSLRDDLTGLPNRLAAIRFIESISTDGKVFWVFFIDIRNLSDFNRMHGYESGDLLIREVVARIQGLSKLSSTFRISDAQLMVVHPSIASNDEAMEFCGMVLGSLCRPYLIAGQTVSVNFAIGGVRQADDSCKVNSLLDFALKALRNAKRTGLNEIVFFEQRTVDEHDRRLQLITQLQQAIANGDLELHYQPKLRLADGQLLGYEALLRWPRTDGSFIDPAVFIPLAEESGLITPLSRWVLNQACEQIASWIKMGLGEIAVAVNISAVHMSSGTLEADVEAALQKSGIPAHLLELELTESLLLEDKEKSLSTMGWLKSRGIRTYLDDFGTGYASIAYLNTFGFDCVKVDKSFITSLLTDNKQKLLYETVVMLVHRLGLKLVAEGVETPEQLECLKAMGVDEGQGYLFARPCNAAEIGARHRSSF